MRQDISLLPHVVYGIYFRSVLIYIGCTHNLEQRIIGLMNQTPALKQQRREVVITPIGFASSKEHGHRLETRLITKEIASGNKHLANGMPSVTMQHGPEKDKELWRGHWRKSGGYPASPYRKRGFRNWSVMRFKAVISSLKNTRVPTA